MKALLIDNYDSFTYNVAHSLRDVGLADVDVVRNTAIDLAGLSSYDVVVASPGPGLPATSGQLLAAVKHCLQQRIPYLGICLGHQALGEAVGATLIQLETVYHGVQHHCVFTPEEPLFAGIPDAEDPAFPIGRYHSWAVSAEGLPSAFIPLAHTSDGIIQAARVVDTCAYGLQFHPESIMTADAGPLLLQNFLTLAKQYHD